MYESNPTPPLKNIKIKKIKNTNTNKKRKAAVPEAGRTPDLEIICYCNLSLLPLSYWDMLECSSNVPLYVLWVRSGWDFVFSGVLISPPKNSCRLVYLRQQAVLSCLPYPQVYYYYSYNLLYRYRYMDGTTIQGNILLAEEPDKVKDSPVTNRTGPRISNRKRISIINWLDWAE